MITNNQPDYLPLLLFEIILTFYFHVNVCGRFYDLNYINLSVMTVDYKLMTNPKLLVVLLVL